jgi:membrane protein DedA with SNARE-associated domain
MGATGPLVSDNRSAKVNRFFLPLIGLTVALTAYALQNVWGLVHVETVATFIRGRDITGMMLCIGVLGLIEATVIACLYLPGTAILIALLVILRPSGATAIAVVLALNAGTALGYAASWLIGRAIQSHLLRFMGETYVAKVKAAIERYGVASLVILAAHPNNLALAFAILGAASVAAAVRYFIVAIALQNVWWLGFASVADLFMHQQVITSTNFYLYLAAVFAAWLAYEIVRRKRP